MKKLVFLSLLSFLTYSLQAQESATRKQAQPETPQQGSWTVNKEYDESGKLIAVDSTYSYHAINGKPVSKEEADSLLQHFKKQLPSGFTESSALQHINSKSIQELMQHFDSEDLDSFFEDFEADSLNSLLSDEGNNEALRDMIKNIDSDLYKDFFQGSPSDLQDEIQELLKDHRDEINELYQQYFPEEKRDIKTNKEDQEHSSTDTTTI